MSAISSGRPARPNGALRDAGLIRSERVGVEMQNASRCGEIDKRFAGLLAAILGALRTQSGADVKRAGSKAKGKAK